MRITGIRALITTFMLISHWRWPPRLQVFSYSYLKKDLCFEQFNNQLMAAVFDSFVFLKGASFSVWGSSLF